MEQESFYKIENTKTIKVDPSYNQVIPIQPSEINHSTNFTRGNTDLALVDNYIEDPKLLEFINIEDGIFFYDPISKGSIMIAIAKELVTISICITILTGLFLSRKEIFSYYKHLWSNIINFKINPDDSSKNKSFIKSIQNKKFEEQNDQIIDKDDSKTLTGLLTLLTTAFKGSITENNKQTITTIVDEVKIPIQETSERYNSELKNTHFNKKPVNQNISKQTNKSNVDSNNNEDIKTIKNESSNDSDEWLIWKYLIIMITLILLFIILIWRF